MLLLDVLVRYPTITLLLLMAFFCLRGAKGNIQRLLGGLTALSMAAVQLGTAPEILKLPEPFFTVIRWSDITNFAFLWLFGLSLFRDDFKMGKMEWAGLGIYTLVVGIIRAWDLGYIPDLPAWLLPFNSAFSLLLTGHLIWTALSGRQDDLVEDRRRGRLWFALGMTLAGAISISAEALFYDTAPHLVDLLRGVVTLPIIVWAWFWLADLRFERLLFIPENKSVPAAPKPEIDPKDNVTHSRLIALMEDESYYTEQGLTIRSLSEKLKVPEHQLRVLINQGMGYRNFAAFLNHYRLGYAKQVLSDPAQARLPVLTIAMDAGFNSLAPFNRAFKQTEGITPTAFRKDALSKAVQS